MTERSSMQSIMQQHLESHAQNHPLSKRQWQVCHHILDCRTEALGGMKLQCDHCGGQQEHYFSCRDRHCPGCQNKATEAWSMKQQANILPVTYHHLVFTLPHILNPWMAIQPREIYGLLFESAWNTLNSFGRKRLKGRIGMVAALHTWGQVMTRHVHLHCLVPGGALSSGRHWQGVKGDYLFPVRALSRHFRGGFISRLRHSIGSGELPRLKDTLQTKETLNQLMAVEWVVYSKPCLHYTATVIDYLARYSHRIALSDHRLQGINDRGKVLLSYKDYRDHDKRKTLPLKPEELIRRFLLHVLPKGFMRIRHFGYLANCCRKRCLSQIRELLATPQESESGVGMATEVLFEGYPCPTCHKGQLRIIAHLLPRRYEGG
ncbi:MAG: IS91 family transposase [Candidatus Sedimenticola sp. (ex Thyasira tokunagai)]